MVATIAASHSELVRPPQALVLQLQRKPWQALTAACLTPAFYNSEYAVPLVLDDGSEKREVAMAHDTATVASFGSTAAAATAKLATTYWKKAPCVFVVETLRAGVVDRAQRGDPFGPDPRAAGRSHAHRLGREDGDRRRPGQARRE